MENNIEKKFVKLLIGRKGGCNTIKIIDALLIMPMNANQIAKKIGVDYNTVRHHTALLVKQDILKKEGDNYGALYKPSKYLKDNRQVYIKVKSMLKNSGLI